LSVRNLKIWYYPFAHTKSPKNEIPAQPVLAVLPSVS
jgi:hypothetical protein